LLRTSISIPEALAVSAICFGYFILGSIQAVASGFPTSSFDNGVVWHIIRTELVLGAVALVFLHLRGFDIRSLVPRFSLAGAGVGVCLYIAAWIGSAIFAVPFMTPQSAQAVQSIASESSHSFASVIALALVNGTFEEVFLLGVLVSGLRSYGLSIAVGLSLLVRLLYHLYQGPFGAMQILGFGLVLTIFYVRFGTLWPPVFAHILGDAVPFV
jgi:uncharacterized protein